MNHTSGTILVRCAIGVTLSLALSSAAGPKPAAKLVLASGRKVYTAHCAACHGVDGKPAVPNSPDFSTRAYKKSVSDAKLAQVTVKGGKTMPPFKDKLSRADVTSVVAYIRSLGNK